MKLKTDSIAVGLPDAHLDPFDDELHPAYLAARSYCFDTEPDILVWMGDTGEFASLSNWNKKKPRFAEGRRYRDDYEIVKDELYLFANRLPKAKKFYIIGNHDQRAQWYVDKNPEMEEHIDLINDLQLEEMGYTVVPYNEALQIGQLWWAHGWYWNKYHAAKTLNDFGDNIVYCHVHHLQQETRNIHFAKKEQTAQSLGCLTSRYPDYKQKRPTRHQNGFCTVEYNHRGEFQLYPHIIIKGEFSYGGYTWKG